MENTFFTLRQWAYRFRQRHQKKPERKPLPILPGLPDGITMEVLEDVCARHLNCAVVSVAHVHLSGWKSTGAYRLMITTPAGDMRSLIYKNAHYGASEIPALRGFPANPGPPEYEIYRQPSGALARYLPQIYAADEIVPAKTYRYLLEDLRPEYRLSKEDSDKIHAASLLPTLHRALAEWASTADTSHLIRYDRTFSEELQEYTRISLEQYARQSDSRELRTILSQWTSICQVHLLPEFFTGTPLPIHGDANFSNIHLHKNEPDRFKVVDWEWAGFGTPAADLSAVLNGSLFETQRKAFSRFFNDSAATASEKQEFRRYLWSNLERSIFDAGFIAAQQMNATNQTRINMSGAVSRSLNSILFYYRQLS